MKKILLIVCAALISISSLAQSTHHFYCDAISIANDKAKECKTGNMEWAKRLLNIFPLSPDGYISHIYTIEASDTINVSRAMIIVQNWMGDIFSNAKNSIRNKDDANHTILGAASFGFLGQENGFTRVSYITGNHEIKVEIYPKSILIKIRLKQYNLTGFNAFKGANADVVGINQVYPIVTKGDYKPAFAQAFINANSVCLRTAYGLLDWLNKHYDTINADETW